MQLSIHAKQLVADDIVELELVAPQGGELPAFTAGSHIELSLGNGLKRCYSLVNDPAERHRYVVAVNKDPSSRGGSRFVHEELQAGQTLDVSEPRNNFRLVEDAPLVTLIAGGIGVTPLLCMIRRLEALGRPWKLLYSARNRSKAAYLDAVQALEVQRPGRVTLHFFDESGQVPDLQAAIADTPPDAHVYCCGPAPMLAAFEKACALRDQDTVHVEYFSAQQAAATEGGFDVVLSHSGKTLHVGCGQSILQVLLASGLEVSHACQEGVCGACQTTVIEGQPDHRDSFLTPKEKCSGKTIMLCCSGSKSDRLVLDL